jgi:hypothetical protein
MTVTGTIPRNTKSPVETMRLFDKCGLYLGIFPAGTETDSCFSYSPNEPNLASTEVLAMHRLNLSSWVIFFAPNTELLLAF